MTALLASVRSVDEADIALAGGADIVDLKDPAAGALGALPLALIETIVAHVRARARTPVSATVGDLDEGAHDEMVRRVQLTAATGVDFVKVGILRGPSAHEALRRLAELPVRVVPLFLADTGIDLALVDAACASGFPVVMVDTADKRRGSLFDCVSQDVLREMVGIVHRAGARTGLAGSLRFEHVPRLVALATDIAGFRGALCDGDRAGPLSAARLHALRAAFDKAARSSEAINVR